LEKQAIQRFGGVIDDLLGFKDNDED